MEFFTQGVEVLKTLVIAIGGGLGAWGVRDCDDYFFDFDKCVFNDPDIYWWPIINVSTGYKNFLSVLGTNVNGIEPYLFNLMIRFTRYKIPR